MELTNNLKMKRSASPSLSELEAALSDLPVFRFRASPPRAAELQSSVRARVSSSSVSSSSWEEGLQKWLEENPLTPVGCSPRHAPGTQSLEFVASSSDGFGTLAWAPEQAVPLLRCNEGLASEKLVPPRLLRQDAVPLRLRVPSSSSSEDPFDGMEVPWLQKAKNTFSSLAEELIKPVRQWLDEDSSSSE